MRIQHPGMLSSIRGYQAIAPIAYPEANEWLVEFATNLNGSDESTSAFSEDSFNATNCTPTAGAKLDDEQVKFGTTSIKMVGTGDRLVSTDGTEFDIGTSNFYVEAWIYPDTATTTLQSIAGRTDVSMTNNYLLSLNASTGVLQWDGEGTITASGTTDLRNTDTWQHVAYSREGTTGRLFVNGIKEGTAPDSNNYGTSTSVFWVGNDNRDTTNNWFRGWIDDVRFGVGEARFVSDFTVPAAEFETPVIQLLLGFNGADAATSTTDDSRYVKTVTFGSGEAELDTAQQKFGTASLLLEPTASVDPSEAFVSLPDSALWRIDTDVTVEGFFRFNDLTDQTQTFFSQYLNTGNQRAFWCYRGGSDFKTEINVDGTSSITVGLTGAFSWVINTWYHIAFVRSGNDWMQFIDGVQIGPTVVSSIDGFNSTAPFRIGKVRSATFDDQPFDGWVDEVRFTRGLARYTSNFTPPTAAFDRTP